MLQKRLLNLTTRLIPSLNTSNETIQRIVAGDLLKTLYAIPLVLIGLVWLALQTDGTLLVDQVGLVVLLAALKFLFGTLRFNVALEIKPGVPAYALNKMDRMIIWSAALILGPSSLWIGVLWEIIDFVRALRLLTAPEERLNRTRELVNRLVWLTLLSLIALAVYRALGGDYPPSAFTLRSAAAGLIATLVKLTLEILSELPFGFYDFYAIIRRLDPSFSRNRFLGFTLLATAIPNLIEPFAVLGALLYGAIGLGAYLYLVAGVLLASVIAHRFSQTLDLNRQQTRNVQQLEALGRDIISGPPDASTLPDLLKARVPGMFGFAGIEIRFFPDELILHQPDEWALEVDIFWAWARAQKTHESQTFAQGSTLPWSNKKTNSGHMYVPITDIDTHAIIGGIYVVHGLEAKQIPRLLPAAQTLAAQIASARHGAQVYIQTLQHQRVEQEMAFAGTIQASFMPTVLPNFPDWRISVSLESARETSGDFYDLIDLPGGKLGVVVADVADKGMGAALYMALSRTLLRTYAVEHPDHPAEALAAANHRILLDTHTDMFVTLFYAAIDTISGTVTYCNAGHNPAYLVPADGGAEQALGRTGIPLGMFEESTWKEKQVTVSRGDRLILYTDGVTEAQDKIGSLFGEERLLPIIRDLRDRSASEIHDAIQAAVKSFVGDTPQSDDITLAVIARTD